MPYITRWAIKHIGSGWYLPEPTGRSFGEIEPEPLHHETPPQLFESEQAAKIAARHWVQARAARSIGDVTVVSVRLEFPK